MACELTCCLKDCGFSGRAIDEFVKAYGEADYSKQIQLLEKQRKTMLDEMHRAGKSIDCIDYMIMKCRQKLAEED